MPAHHPAALKPKLKKQGTWGSILSRGSSFRKSTKSAATSFKRLFVSTAPPSTSGGRPQARGNGNGVASFSEADLVKSASSLVAKKDTWAGTLSVTDEDFQSRYFVRQKLGAGSFGIVHRVIRVSDGLELAAKTIEHRGHDSEWAEALEEARVWAAVSSPFHPAILPLLETLEVEGRTLHLVTELMPCDVLGDAIFNVIMSEQASRLIIVQLVSAVAHLHLVHGLAHRDLKPDNVLCANPDPTILGCLKLADFGLCKPFRAGAEEGESFADAVGTLDYAAPELAAGFVPPAESGDALPEVRYGPRVDVWALGCVCYELLHGQPPFYVPQSEGGEDETIRRVLDEDLVQVALPDASFGHISAAGKAFLAGMLAPSPAERWSIHEALDAEWLQPVSDASLRIAMCSSPSQTKVAQRRAERTNTLLKGAAQKVLAANRISKGAAANHGEPEASAAKAAQPTEPRIVAKPDGSFRAKSSSKKAVSAAAPKPPKRLLCAPSGVTCQPPESSSSASVLAAVASRDQASSSDTDMNDTLDAAREIDPMAHYVGVYKGLFRQNELFASPERRQLAAAGRRQGLSLAEMSAEAERAAKEKKARALQPLEA